jgi:hypothetical protein
LGMSRPPHIEPSNHRSLTIDLLEREWRRELAGPAWRSRVRRWGSLEPALRGFNGPTALLRFLGPKTPAHRKDAVLCALLRLAREDRLAAQLVLQTLLPGLKRRLERVLVEADEREERCSLLLYHAWERICTYPVAELPRHVAANLLLSASRDAVRALERERKLPDHDTEEAFPELAELDPAEGDVDALLADAVKAGAVSASEAELIAATRIDRVSLARYAERTGVGYDALRLRRSRAERRLLVHLGNRDVRFGGSKWPVLSARVTGAGSSPLTGERTERTAERR